MYNRLIFTRINQVRFCLEMLKKYKFLLEIWTQCCSYLTIVITKLELRIL